MHFTKQLQVFWIIVAVTATALTFLGNVEVIVLAYITEAMVCLTRTIQMRGQKRLKFSFAAVYVLIMAVQIVCCVTLMSGDGYFVVNRAVMLVLFLAPAVVNRYAVVDKYARFYLPSVQDTATVSFEELKRAAQSVADAAKMADNIGKGFTFDNIKAVVGDLPSHDSFNYVNDGSLTPEYFTTVNEQVDDPNIYIVISRTGSPASEIIGVFTQKLFNHASLSFDRDLRTTISYNGGERVYPPGLNREELRENGACLLVYSLKCTTEQKRMMINKVAEINSQGSAYNMLGLITKVSAKANIMFCSQFVYKILDLAGLAYFDKPAGSVTPTDLIEQDYYRKLQFEYDVETA